VQLVEGFDWPENRVEFQGRDDVNANLGGSATQVIRATGFA
jgi:hypothetical protein